MESTFKLEAIEVLKKANKPLHSKEILRHIIKRGNVRTKGATPEATLKVILIKDIQKNANKSFFKKMENGFFALNSSII